MNRILFEKQLAKFKLLSNVDNLDTFLLSEGRKENARAFASNLTDEEFQELLDGDPSKDSPQNPFKYIEWMARQAKNQYKIKDIIELTKVYDSNLQIIPKDNPIQNFKTLNDLYDFISALDTDPKREISLKTDPAYSDVYDPNKLKPYSKLDQEKFEKIFEDNDHLILRVINSRGSCELGKKYNVKWCLAGGLKGDDYKEEKARGYFKSYVGKQVVLYFIIYKNIPKDNASSAFALLLNKEDNKVTVRSMWKRTDVELNYTTWIKQLPENQEIFNKILQHAKSALILDDAVEILKKISSVEEFNQVLDNFSKVLNGEQFDKFYNIIPLYVNEKIRKDSNYDFEVGDRKNALRYIDGIVKKSVFKTKKINTNSLLQIGDAFEYLGTANGLPNIEREKTEMFIESYKHFFQNYKTFKDTLQPTQYIFMLKKASEVDYNTIVSSDNYSIESGKGLFYTIIVPLFETEIINVDTKSTFQGVKTFMPKLNIIGINRTLLDVLKSELTKKANTDLRKVIIKLVASFDNTPIDGFRKSFKETPELEKYGNSFKSFMYRSRYGRDAYYEREITREIIEAIGSISSNSISGEEVSVIVDYAAKDISSAQTDSERTLTSKKYLRKLPKLIDVLKSNFESRKKYILQKFDQDMRSKEINYYHFEYSESKDDTDKVYGIAPVYYYYSGLGNSQVLDNLNRDEVTTFLLNKQNMVLEEALNGKKRTRGFMEYLETTRGGRNIVGSLMAPKGENLFTNYLVGPELGSFTETSRTNLALNFYGSNGVQNRYNIMNLLNSFSSQPPQNLNDEEKTVILNRVSDYVYDTIYNRLFVKEEEYFRNLITFIKDSLEMPTVTTVDKTNLKRSYAIIINDIYLKLRQLISFATLLSDSVTLTNSYGSENKRQILKAKCRQLLSEKFAVYEGLVNTIMELKKPLGIKKTEGVIVLYDLHSTANAYNLESSNMNILVDCIRVFNDLVSNYQSKSLTENRKIIVRFKNGSKII